MRFLSAVLSSILVFILFISVTIPQMSCSKTVTEHDTVFDLKDGLVAYYNFNNGSLIDSSGRGNNIIFNNATATTDRFGKAGNAYKFTSGNYMRVSNSQSLNPSQITIMAVVKFDGWYSGLAWGNQILMKGFSDQSNGVYGLRAQPTSSNFSLPLDTTTEMFVGFYGDNANAGSFDPSFLIHGGDWNIIVYTYDGFESKLYINGNLRNTVNRPFAYNTNTNDLYIGKTENPPFPYFFDGVIDEIRIYSKALSPELIQKFNTLKN